MKFIITRTSTSGNKKPHSRAIIDKYLSEVYLSEKDYNNKYRIYIIEINTLDDLLRFQEETGEYLIIKNKENSLYLEKSIEMPVIEIYDSYRG